MTSYTEDELLAALTADGEAMPTADAVIEEVVRVKGPQHGPGRKPAAELEYRTPAAREADDARSRGSVDDSLSNEGSASEGCFAVPNGRLFNQSDLSVGFRNLKTEKYEHRIIGYLKAQGCTNVEIASQTGYAASYISQVIRLPWVQHLIIEEIRKNGQDAVEATLKGNVLETVQFVIDTVHNEKVAMRDRIAAAKEHLNRVYGMPTQPIVHHEKVELESLSDEALAQIAYRGSNASRGCEAHDGHRTTNQN